jgi:hypothetical protein
VPILNDREDGVERCGECGWELFHGTCVRCGNTFHDGETTTSSDADEVRSEREDEGTDMSDFIVEGF